MPKRIRKTNQPPNEQSTLSLPDPPPPYSAGVEAGSAVRRMLASRQDYTTCLVEWYRGFCDGGWLTPLADVEAIIRQKAAYTDAPGDAAALAARHMNRVRGDG
jgi:hypothetical protein